MLSGDTEAVKPGVCRERAALPTTTPVVKDWMRQVDAYYGPVFIVGQSIRN